MRFAAVLVGIAVVLAGSAPVLAAGTTPSGPATPTPERPDVSGAGSGVADRVRATDRIGREGGYWHNESIAVDRSDGWNQSELDAVLARTMARVERIRHLEFDGDVSIETQSREAFRREQNRTVSPELRTFDNAKFEALFLVNESADSIAVQRDNTGGSVLGYYDADRDAIVLVVEEGRIRIDELTLAHELVHALQDQYFGLASFDARTRDGRNAQDGLIEGDAAFVEYLYRQRCRAEWACLSPDEAAGSGVRNLGVYLLKFFPYSDGPAFVRHFYEIGGWPRVNALYDRPPASSEQVIHPGRYRSDPPRTIGAIDTAIVSPVAAGVRTPSPSPTPVPTTDDPPSTVTRLSPPSERTPTAYPATTTGVTATATARNDTSTATNGTTPVSNGTTSTGTPTNGTLGSGTPNRTVSTPSRHTPTGTPTPPGTPTPTTPHPTVSTPPETVDVPSATGSPGRETPMPAARWHRVRPPGRPDHATLGEAGIAAMFFYPTYHSDGRSGIVPAEAFLNRENRELASFDPFDYAHRYSEGWDGDRLQVYRNERNETAYVWRIAWDSPAEAREFARGYRRLLAYWGGERVEASVYRLAGRGFDDAIHVDVTGDRVTIVNAPAIELLPSLYRLDSTEERTSGELTVGGAGTTAAGSRVTTRQPGFGPLVALLGIVLALGVLARRRDATNG